MQTSRQQPAQGNCTVPVCVSIALMTKHRHMCNVICNAKQLQLEIVRMQPCTLYASTMGPQRHLFTAAAALFQLTGESKYRDDADSMYWNPKDIMLTKLINWDNPWMLGAAVMAGTKEPKGAAVRNSEYLEAVADTVRNWSQCSNEGQSGDFCKCAPPSCTCQRLSASVQRARGCACAVAAEHAQSCRKLTST